MEDKEENGALREDGAPKAAKPKDRLYEFYQLLHDMVYVLAVVTIVFMFCLRLVGVNGDSMFPTLHNNDYLLLQSGLTKGSYARGDIVVACVPSFENGEPVVKRVVATGGQTVDIVYDAAGGSVSVDGVALSEPYIREMMVSGRYNDLHIEVPEGQLFLMGDNRNHSTDSRYFGCVDERYVLGKALWILLPGGNENTGYSGGTRDFGRFGSLYADD